MTLYLDCNATTPVDPRVQEVVVHYLGVEYGNAGSSHEFGERAKQAVHLAREQIGRAVGARRHEVVFTSGATESSNLAILGLAPYGERIAKRHIVSTRIEHKAVLEPLSVLRQRGFEVTLLPPSRNGSISADDVLQAVREDTLLVSVMDVNNETGVCQPIGEIARKLVGRDVFFHVDAAQGFGKHAGTLGHPRIDLISISGHKIFGPKGIGALIVRRRAGKIPPLTPLLYGGGQELGLRSGTLPVALIAGFGKAAELALDEMESRRAHCEVLRQAVLTAFASTGTTIHGAPSAMLPHVLNVSFPSHDAEEVIDALRGVAAISDGAACTSICPTHSHVLTAMGLASPELDRAVRFSWSHMTDPIELRDALQAIVDRLGHHRAV